jgi:four helix bundle protein
VWRIIIEWNNFARDTVGKQFVTSTDSISVNIAEGFGRYSKKDKIKFCRYNYGSTKEALDWNEKSKIRKLISDKEYNHILEELQRLPKEINHLIKYTNHKLTI